MSALEGHPLKLPPRFLTPPCFRLPAQQAVVRRPNRTSLAQEPTVYQLTLALSSCCNTNKLHQLHAINVKVGSHIFFFQF